MKRTHAFVWLLLSPLVRAETYAVVIGISRYQDVTSVKPLQFANADATSFAALWKATPPNTGHAPCPPMNLKNKIRIFTDEQACAATLREALQSTLSQAGPNDTVYLFLSARGIATNDLADGFILGYDSRREIAGASGLSVNMVERDQAGKAQKPLGDLIAASRAGKIYLFADVSRDPTELDGKSNLINFNLSDLQKRRKDFYVILASQPKQLSRECKELRAGVFDHFLIPVLRNGKLNQAIFQDLSDKMARPAGSCMASPPQKPWVVPAIPANATLEILQPISRVFQDPKILLAFYGPPPAGLLAGIEEQQELNEPPASDPLSSAVALENTAQQVFVTYGEGDQFPNDPLRPGKTDFDRSAELFGRALGMRSSVPPADADFETKVRNSLTSRMQFCKARSLIFDAQYRAALAELDKVPAQDWLAESYNAQGIAYLEQADYPSAIQAFGQSIRLAPDWAYARHNLALAHNESGDYAAAERDYREAIVRTPYHPYLYYNLGVLLHRLNRKKEAEQAYELAIGKFTSQENNFVARAVDWANAGNTTDADRAFTREQVLKLNEAEAHNSLGAVLQAEGRWDRAEEQYTISLKLNPDLNIALYNLGALEVDRSSRRGQGDRLAAGVQLLRQAVQNDANLLPAKIKLAEAQADLDLRQGSKSNACSEYKRALDTTAEPEVQRRLQKKRKAACG